MERYRQVKITVKNKLVQDRGTFIEQFVVGKEVLDAGCTELLGTTTDKGKAERWIHEKIRKVAKEVVGVDINKTEVEALKARGYNIICGDVEEVDIGRKFDVIVAGELMEHLSNPGLFLENMKRHLNEDGVLILTTPNRFHFYSFLKAFITGQNPVYNKPIAAHVHYYDINSLKALIIRHGYQVVDHCFYSEAFPTFKSKLLLKSIQKLRPNFAQGIIMVLQKAAI